MDDRCLAYFSSVNPLARKIFKDQQLLRNALGEEWDKLDWGKQEDLIDDFFVDISVREKFADVERPHEYPVSFPKLKLDTGENIVVDDDFWTWQDEHSSPFNWRTKSQQDLSLDDLDAEALSKPVKHKKKESQANNEEVETAPRQFSVNTGGSIWESPFLQGMKKPEYLNRSASEMSTAESRESLARSKTPEEVNYAFTGSVDDLSSVRSAELNDRSMSISSGEMLTGHQAADTDRHYKPAKRQRSFSKSPIKNVLASSKENDNTDKGSLVTKKDEEQNAFDNPALGHEWSSFVNEDDGPSSATPSPYKKLLKEPEPASIDRGDNFDNSELHLMSGAKVDDHYHDEILVVEQPADDNVDPLNASSLSKTGFDFLDDW